MKNYYFVNNDAVMIITEFSLKSATITMKEIVKQPEKWSYDEYASHRV